MYTSAKVTELVRGGVGTYTWSGSKAQAPSPKPHILLPTLEEAMPVLTPRVNWSGGKPREGLRVVCSPRRTVEGSHMVSIQMVIKCCQFYLHPKHLSLVQAWASLPGYHSHHPILGPGPCSPRSPSLQVFSFLKWREYLRPKEAK